MRTGGVTFSSSCSATLDKSLLKQPFVLPPTPFRSFFSWRVPPRAVLLARHTMNRPRTSPPFHSIPLSSALPAPRFALAHPLCLGVHGIYKHHSASVDSLSSSSSFSSSPIVPVSCLPLPPFASLSLLLHKKSFLLIACCLTWFPLPVDAIESRRDFIFHIFLHFFYLAESICRFLLILLIFSLTDSLSFNVNACVSSYYR